MHDITNCCNGIQPYGLEAGAVVTYKPGGQFSCLLPNMNNMATQSPHQSNFQHCDKYFAGVSIYENNLNAQDSNIVKYDPSTDQTA